MSLECTRMDGINLGQGICDQPVEPVIKQAAIKAIQEDRSIYTRLDGIDELRHRIAKKVRDYNKVPCDADGEVIVNVGSTGSFVAACLALVDPGDEVILFSPFYGYHLNILKVCQASLKYVTLRPPDWSYDRAALEAAFSKKTNFILVNTPSNPCGKVFTRAELTHIADLCRKHDALCITDELYEYMLADFSELGFKDDQEAARVIPERSNVAVIPGSSFYPDPKDGRKQIRLCYAKKMPDLEEACRRIRTLRTVMA